MNKLTKYALTTFSIASSVVATSAIAQEAPTVDVTEAADTFLADFGTAAATIGGVIISAAFIALVWKWAKGMIFS